MLECLRMDGMAQALTLARLALGSVSPNPAVGAVLVKHGKLVGQGHTQPPGGDHAEIVALKQAAGKARGATLYVTLEPCCHQGRTPPCTGAIIEAGVAAVHAAMLDPNPKVAGKGIAELEAAGIGVIVGEGAAEAAEIAEAYVKHVTSGLPFVTAKFAVSLDGKIATRTGDSRWISGEESRRYVHGLRHATDAIMAGINTVLTDDPRLTARVGSGQGGTGHRQPLRVIIDSSGRTPPEARLFQEYGQTMIVTGGPLKPEPKAAYQAVGAEILEIPLGDGRVDLAAMLQQLGARGITSVLVEGGGTLLGSLFAAELVDKVVAFVAPIIIGGAQAATPVGGHGVALVADAWQLNRVKVDRFDTDIMVSGYLKV